MPGRFQALVEPAQSAKSVDTFCKCPVKSKTLLRIGPGKAREQAVKPHQEPLLWCVSPGPSRHEQYLLPIKRQPIIELAVCDFVCKIIWKSF